MTAPTTAPTIAPSPTPSDALSTPAPGPLSQRLKVETQAMHTAAERHVFHQLLFSGTLPVDRLAEQHAAAGRVQSALERALDNVQTACPEVAAVYRGYHRRADLYTKDVAGLSAAPRSGASAPEAAFTARLSGWASTDPIALLGALYVLEGSTNGGPFIQKAMARSMPGVTLSALNPHGPDQAPRWTAFKTAIDGLGLTRDRQDAVVRAAAETFSALCSIMSASTAGLAPAGRPSAPAH